MWRRLSESHRELRSPFFSLEFARAVAQSGARARVCLLYEKGTLAGFFPFQFADTFTRSLAAGERIGGALNDFFGVILDRSRHLSIGVPDLLHCAGLTSVIVSHLEETQTCLGLPAGTRSQGARIRLPNPDLEHYWESVKAGHPSAYATLRNRERKIEREFRQVDFVFAHDEPGGILPTVVAEKRRQYAETGTGDGFAKLWKVRCLEGIARHREGRCAPLLSTLHLDGTWAALHFGIRAGNVLHYWFPVYNPQFSGLSPGLVLLAKMIREAPRHGIDEIDLGEGLSRYKTVFATEFYPLCRDLWYRASLRGLAYRGFLSLSWRARLLARR